MAQDHQTIRDLFDDWNAALATGDPDQVVRLYAEDAVLLPTISDQVCTDHAGIRNYFTEFLTLRPQGEVLESHVRVFTGVALHSGVYRFTLAAEGRQVDARFTFGYRLDEDGWKIIEHHSSAMPEG